jgi:hypothetical protein
VIATLAAASAAAQESAAQESSMRESTASMTAGSERSGLEVSVGVGFQAGAGYVYKNGQRLDGTRGDLKLSDGSSGAVPVQLEVGYRLNDTWFAGLFGQYTYVITKENPYSCPTGFDCSSTLLRFGPRLQYHVSPASSFDPYVGLGVGIIMLSSSVEGQTTVPTQVGPLPADLDIKSKTRGPEFINLTLGARWRLSDSLSLGPALDITYNSYTVRTGTSTVNIPAAGVSQSGPISGADDGPFALFILTIRGTYNL